MTRDHLRPVERAVLRHADEGRTSAEIAWRFRRSPGYIERVLALSRMPRAHSAHASRAHGSPLRPVERRVLRARRDGEGVAEIAARLRRSPGYVARVERYAAYKLAHDEGTRT